MGLLLFIIFFAIFVLINASSICFKEKKVLFYSPLYFFSLAWCLSLLIYQFGDDFLRGRTIISMAVFYFSFCIPAFIFLMKAGTSLTIRQLIEPLKMEGFEYRRLVLLLIGLQLLSVCIALTYLYYAISFSGFSFSDLLDQPGSLATVRGILANEDYNVPLILKLTSQVKYVNYFAPIIITTISVYSLLSRKYIGVSIALAILYSICFLERSGIIRTILVFGVFYSLYFVNNRKKLLQLIASGMILVVIATVTVPYLRGQADEGGGNLYDYVVGGLGGLDAFISGYNGEISILETQQIYITEAGFQFGDAPVGFETMTELYRICNALFQCGFEIPNNKEYIYSPIMTNIYTAIRAFYQDYGAFGAPLIIAVIGIFVSWRYLLNIQRGGIWTAYFNSYLAYLATFSVLTYNFSLREIILVWMIMTILSFIFRSRPLFFGYEPRNM
ncbi:MAG TPA: hypothetical protein DCP03_14505 [Polaromonas sp.]|uniref:O-antigen polymerase n=1 Tax=Polaromonas sp. UBA4122 TaxID=1947074 RepID=UPI000EBA98EF|nr:O-antigen polymerase [Polaromonas sp. UBA4122]HAL39240.1 hypothetical protein [Polaromonas sp.]